MSPRDLHRTRGLPVLEEALILAVDDTPANLVALERVLGSIEARIIRASSGEEALALCLRHRFALAILDVQMPGMDGYELAEILLGDPATSRTPLSRDASQARTMPASELRSTTPRAGMPNSAARAKSSAGWLAPRRKE